MLQQRYRKFKRTWGTFFAYDNLTGNSVTLKTKNKVEAERKVQAMNQAESQPAMNLGLARVYMNGADPKLVTRTWQEVMEGIVAQKTDETRRRWEVAIKDRNFDCIRNRPVAETRPEHFHKALADGKVSTNVYLRRVHNHALGMDWLLKPVIPRLQWPKPLFKGKRAITVEEHRAIIEAEAAAAERNRGSRNSDQPHYDERRDFYDPFTLTVNHARIVSTFAAAGGKAVQVDGSDYLTLKDCVLVSSVPAATSIDAGAAQNVRLYGSTMANKAAGGNVTFLTGGSRFEVDANVR
jgi:hypothetical protein